MATVLHPAPRFASNEGVRETLSKALGSMLLASKEEHGEIVLGVERERIEDALRLLRDAHGYQQLMEIAGVDYPSRDERFEVVYMLLSLTKNHRILVKVRAAENTPVPTVTTLWPVAGWLEREVFDMYGVVFDGNTGRLVTSGGLITPMAGENMPAWAIAYARSGEVALLPTGDSGRVRAVVELDLPGDLFLLVGRPVDAQVLGHMERTEQAVSQYRQLEASRSGLQITFALVYAAGSATGSGLTGAIMEAGGPQAGPISVGLGLVVFTAVLVFSRR